MSPPAVYTSLQCTALQFSAVHNTAMKCIVVQYSAVRWSVLGFVTVVSIAVLCSIWLLSRAASPASVSSPARTLPMSGPLCSQAPLQNGRGPTIEWQRPNYRVAEAPLQNFSRPSYIRPVSSSELLVSDECNMMVADQSF